MKRLARPCCAVRLCRVSCAGIHVRRRRAVKPSDSLCDLHRVALAVLLAVALGRTGLAADRPGIEAAPHPVEVGSDFTLGDCLRLAMENHPTLVVGRAQVAQSSGEAYQAGLPPNPKYDPGGP